MPARRSRDELSPDGAQVVLEVGHIAAAPGGPVHRAEALLETLRPLLPFDAALVALLHPERREHVFLVRSGYDRRTCAHLDSPAWMDDIELVGLQRERAPLRVCDSPVPAREVIAWAQYMVPAGFREGLGVGLFTPDGRYLGMLAVHSGSPVPATDAVRDLVGSIAPLLAHAVDPMRELGVVAGVVHDALGGILLTDGGTVLPLPGLSGHHLLTVDSPVVGVVVAARSTGDGRLRTSFLCPESVEDGTGGHLRITVLAVPSGTPTYERAAVVVVSSPGDLHGLTSRELEVLGLLVEGWPNRAIAADLGITGRTVAAHVEHILTKFAVTSRTVAAVGALRRGLFVPRLLHHATRPAGPDHQGRRPPTVFP